MQPHPDAARPPVSRWRQLLLPAIVAMVAALIWGLHYRARFTSLWYPDACDYAQLGRQLALGAGHTSQQTFPYVLSWLAAHGFPTTEPWPNVTRFVLPPLERAISFRLFGVSDFAAVFPEALFFSATALACYSLARRLAGPIAGFAAAMMVMASPTMLHYALSGLSETGAAWFLVAIGAVLVRTLETGDAAPRRAWILALMLGALCGLAFLQRSNLALCLVAALAIFLVQARQHHVRTRLALAGASCIAAALVALPWLLRNWLAFGSPTLSLTVDRNVALALLGSDPFDGFALVDSARIVAEHRAEVLHHLGPSWLIDNWRDLFGSDLRMFVPAFLATPLLPMTREGRALRRYAWIVVVLTWILSAPLVIHTTARYYTPFAPLVVLVVCCGVTTAIMRVHPSARWLVYIATLVVAVMWINGSTAANIPRRDARLALWDAMIDENVAPGSIVGSDQSWYVAWQADRPAVRFHGDALQLEQLERLTPVSALWLGKQGTAAFERSAGALIASGQWRLASRDQAGTSLWLRREASPGP